MIEMTTLQNPMFLFTLMLFISGCVQRNPSVPATTLSAIAGEWKLDLSAKQDQSDLKKLQIVPDGRYPNTFSGVVYDNSTFDNGIALETPPNLYFSFVSDEEGGFGGPYYWLGATIENDQLGGTVQSLTRKFQQRWIARRPATTQSSK